MNVRVQMVLAIFIIACTLGAEPEYKVISVLLRSSTDRTTVLGDSCIPCRLISSLLSGKIAVHLPLRAVHPDIIARCEEKYNKIEHRRTYHKRIYKSNVPIH